MSHFHNSTTVVNNRILVSGGVTNGRFPLADAWEYDPATKETRITGGGEISGRVISPAPLGVDPLPREQWPTRASLTKRKGWRISVPV